MNLTKKYSDRYRTVHVSMRSVYVEVVMETVVVMVMVVVMVVEVVGSSGYGSGSSGDLSSSAD